MGPQCLWGVSFFVSCSSSRHEGLVGQPESLMSSTSEQGERYVSAIGPAIESAAILAG